MSERNGRRYIPQQLVDAFVNSNSQYKKWKAKRDSLREEVIDADNKGLECSPGSPFIISVIDVPVRRVNWQQAYETLAKRTIPATWRKEKARVIASTPKVPETKVTVAPNPALARR